MLRFVEKSLKRKRVPDEKGKRARRDSSPESADSNSASEPASDADSDAESVLNVGNIKRPSRSQFEDSDATSDSEDYDSDEDAFAGGEGSDEEEEDEDDDDLSPQTILQHPIQEDPKDARYSLCAICPTKELKNQQMVDTHLDSNAHKRRWSRFEKATKELSAKKRKVSLLGVLRLMESQTASIEPKAKPPSVKPQKAQKQEEEPGLGESGSDPKPKPERASRKQRKLERKKFREEAAAKQPASARSEVADGSTTKKPAKLASDDVPVADTTQKRSAKKPPSGDVPSGVNSKAKKGPGRTIPKKKKAKVATS